MGRYHFACTSPIDTPKFKQLTIQKHCLETLKRAMDEEGKAQASYQDAVHAHTDYKSSTAKTQVQLQAKLNELNKQMGQLNEGTQVSLRKRKRQEEDDDDDEDAPSLSPVIGGSNNDDEQQQQHSSSDDDDNAMQDSEDDDHDEPPPPKKKQRKN